MITEMERLLRARRIRLAQLEQIRISREIEALPKERRELMWQEMQVYRRMRQVVRRVQRYQALNGEHIGYD